MHLKEWFSRTDPCRQYDSHERLFRGLQHLENAAILCLQLKAMNSVKKLVRRYGLPPEQADDILNQSTLIFLRKIGDGSYQFQHHAPSTYLVEIARRVVMSATRSQKKSEEIGKYGDLPDPAITIENNNADLRRLHPVRLSGTWEQTSRSQKNRRRSPPRHLL